LLSSTQYLRTYQIADRRGLRLELAFDCLFLFSNLVDLRGDFL